ncbi:MAG: hypothetical protein Q8M11_10060 [Sulfuritalea sp.]|nr:hypothetical protein [Sulfuritalea sp.]MDP1981637.1 hypothetical protein [Sulfuritalea sp.]
MGKSDARWCGAGLAALLATGSAGEADFSSSLAPFNFSLADQMDFLARHVPSQSRVRVA